MPRSKRRAENDKVSIMWSSATIIFHLYSFWAFNYYITPPPGKTISLHCILANLNSLTQPLFNIDGKNEEYLERRNRCIDPDFLIPYDRPFICEYNKKRGHEYVSKCCKDKDLCNEGLDLQLATPIKSSYTNSTTDSSLGSLGKSDINSSLPLSLTVLLPACLVVTLLLISLGILALICRRKDSVRIKCLCFECVHRGGARSTLSLNGGSSSGRYTAQSGDTR